MASATVRLERSIATMATRRDYQMERCFAGRLMKALEMAWEARRGGVPQRLGK